jgi:hypothetical protein
MICGVDVNARPNLWAVSNQNFDHIQDDAVEIDERSSTEFDVEAVVTKEWGLTSTPSPTKPSLSNRSDFRCDGGEVL